MAFSASLRARANAAEGQHSRAAQRAPRAESRVSETYGLAAEPVLVEHDSSLGADLKRFVCASPSAEAIASLVPRLLRLLRALHVAYSAPGFQAQITRLHWAAAGDEHVLLDSLQPVVALVQAPVFARFGLQEGLRGVMTMKAAVKRVSRSDAEVALLAGDLRELLGLVRAEPNLNLTDALEDVRSKTRACERQVAEADPDARRAFARTLGLQDDCSFAQIAQEVPQIPAKAQNAADRLLAQGRSAVVGESGILGPTMANASDAELREALVANIERHMHHMWARLTLPLNSYTCDPRDWKCEWADSIIKERHAVELWSCDPQYSSFASASTEMCSPFHGRNLLVIDGVLRQGLADVAIDELYALEAAGKLEASANPCNTGARSVWLHFETESQREALPGALQELCMNLAGVASALEVAADRSPPMACLNVPALRIHPHVMAATYSRGAQYRCHKDSYDGADNQRMLTALLYLNSDWRPGDGGELRVFGSTVGEDGKDASDLDSFIDIEPLSGRLVIFRSRDLWHAVNEPRKQRWALTLWIMGA